MVSPNVLGRSARGADTLRVCARPAPPRLSATPLRCCYNVFIYWLSEDSTKKDGLGQHADGCSENVRLENRYYIEEAASGYHEMCKGVLQG